MIDLDMPVMGGETFIQQCRRMPGLDDVPILVMSGQAESDMSRECLGAARVSGYLVKPFGVEDLSTAVECHIPPSDLSCESVWPARPVVSRRLTALPERCRV